MRTKTSSELLRNLLNQRHLSFLKRGNEAIKLALRLAKEQGRTTLLIPDQGGWITYPQYGKQLGFKTHLFPTQHGLFDEQICQHHDGAVLLLNSLPAYTFQLPMERIAHACKQHNILLINDVSASIGSLSATFGDYTIGSFNHWKPIPLQQGGFIAAQQPLPPSTFKPDENLLIRLLETLPERTATIKKQAQQLKQHLSPSFPPLFPQHQGYNVIVPYKNEQEQQLIIQRSQELFPNIAYTLCPRFIRVNEQAISFELKRFFDQQLLQKKEPPHPSQKPKN